MIDESKPQIFEKKEKEPWQHIKVFRVRHGNTPYHEQLEGIPGDKIDLTEKGIKEIENAAEKISSNIDKDQDIVCFGFSPRKRTIDSANIIRTYLIKNGFTVWEDPKNREEQIKKAFVISDKARRRIDKEFRQLMEKLGCDLVGLLEPVKRRVERRDLSPCVLQALCERVRKHLERKKKGKWNASLLEDISKLEGAEAFLKEQE